MIYAQIKRGQRLHLALEPGEELTSGYVVRAGCLSLPICGRKFKGAYRMTCNMSLASACRNCMRVWNNRYRRGGNSE